MERLRGVARDVAWTPPQNVHVTLKFLGGVDAARLPAVTEALAAAARGGAPFDLALRGLGAFPSPMRPRVLWAGAGEGEAAASALASRVEAALGSLGFAPEARPFACHATLGRVREPRRQPALTEALAVAAARDFGRFSVRHLFLMRSELSPRGARYSEIAACPLG